MLGNATYEIIGMTLESLARLCATTQRIQLREGVMLLPRSILPAGQSGNEVVARGQATLHIMGIEGTEIEFTVNISLVTEAADPEESGRLDITIAKETP